jgi:hypothetical protein
MTSKSWNNRSYDVKINTFTNAKGTESSKDIKQFVSGLGIANYRVY